MNQKTLQQLAPEDADLAQKIARIKPDDEFYSGRVFFQHLLLDAGGAEVRKFLKEAAAKKPGSLETYLHFNEVASRAYQKTLVRAWSRREFLNTFGWGMGGAISMTAGAAFTADDIDRIARREPLWDHDPDHSIFYKTGEFVVRVPGALPEFFLGAALVQEGVDKWDEIKLEQIADAVEVLTKMIDDPNYELPVPPSRQNILQRLKGLLNSGERRV